MAGSFFWEMRQQQNIAGARGEAQSAARAAESAQSNLKYLEDKVANLTLVCRAMWELLQEKHGMTDEELLARVQQLGTASQETASCGQCGRVLGKRLSKCMYCGAERQITSVFEMLGA
ncbi:MAG: hypothetical protein AB7S38_19870 [Vulcanimicrobiota bacterium]